MWLKCFIGLNTLTVLLLVADSSLEDLAGIVIVDNANNATDFKHSRHYSELRAAFWQVVLKSDLLQFV